MRQCTLGTPLLGTRMLGTRAWLAPTGGSRDQHSELIEARNSGLACRRPEDLEISNPGAPHNQISTSFFPRRRGQNLTLEERRVAPLVCLEDENKVIAVVHPQITAYGYTPSNVAATSVHTAEAVPAVSLWVTASIRIEVNPRN